jgi:hypothetical protein
MVSSNSWTIREKMNGKLTTKPFMFDDIAHLILARASPQLAFAVISDVILATHRAEHGLARVDALALDVLGERHRALLAVRARAVGTWVFA